MGFEQNYQRGKDYLRQVARLAASEGQAIMNGSHGRLTLRQAREVFRFHPNLSADHLDAIYFQPVGEDDRVQLYLALPDYRYGPEIYLLGEEDTEKATELAFKYLCLAYAVIWDNEAHPSKAYGVFELSNGKLVTIPGDAIAKAAERNGWPGEASAADIAKMMGRLRKVLAQKDADPRELKGVIAWILHVGGPNKLA